MEEKTYDKLLDVSGLNCPLPVLKSKAALAGMGSGQILQVISTHPDSQKEFPALCRMPGLELIEARQEDERYIYRVQKL